MAKKPAKKPAKPVKKAAAKKVAKSAKPAAKSKAKSKPAKPVKKAAPKKASAPAKKKAPAKVVKKAVVKKVAAKPVAKKAVVKPTKQAAPKKIVASKPAPKAVAKAAPKAAVAKPVTHPAKPVAAPKTKKKNVKKEAKEVVKAAPLVTQVSVPNRPMPPPVVKKQVSTLMSADKLRYNDDELEEFKEIIMKKLDEARKDYDLLKQTLANTDNNGTDDTSPSFKMIEDGSETLSREETAQLAARQEKFIKHLEDAQLRIRNKTYGICRVTGRLISKERLRLVPHATLSIEAKQQMGN